MKRNIRNHLTGVAFLTLLTGATALALPTSTAHASDANATTPEGRPDFVILRPDDHHPFWDLFEKTMKDACEDLGCNVSAPRADWDHYKMIEQAKALGKQDEKPDMVFFQSFKNNGDALIKALDAAGINGFLVNAGLTKEQAAEMGKPREKYTHWIAQMMPDDYGAGKSTAEALYAKAKEQNLAKNGKIKIAAIEGNSADGASIERVRGLKEVVAKYPDLELLQIVQGKWDPDISKKMAHGLMRRHTDLRVIWAAGDPVAFGVVDAAKESNKKDGEILTTGVDWAPRALNEIENGRMLGSAGGHFMEGAWSAIAAYDYLKGRDFKSTEGLKMNSQMGFLNKDTLPVYRDKFGNGDFSSVNFKKFSKYYNADRKKYTFDIAELLESDE